MQLRVTLFWNDLLTNDEINISAGHETSSEWTMKGRDRACRRDLNDDAIKECVDVPPVSILNSVCSDTVGEDEVTMLDYETRLMR
jgi:hypothetical protein